MALISVCIPTYNGARYIRDCLDSVIKQDFADFELIVVDDNSTDRTYEILAQYTDPRLRLHRNQTRLGLVENWNHCIELATGDYIIIFHQDDVMQLKALQSLYKLFYDHPEIGFSFSNVEIIDECGKVTGTHWSPGVLPDTTVVISGQHLLERIFHNGNIVPCQTVMVRKTCYQHQGYFDSRLQLTPDLEMWLRLASTYDAAYHQEQLIRIRQHSQQTSQRFTDRNEILEVWRAFWIYFNNHRAAASSPGFYQVALEHLAGWTRIMLRSQLRHLRFSQAIQLIALWIRFSSYRRSGLSQLPASP